MGRSSQRRSTRASASSWIARSVARRARCSPESRMVDGKDDEDAKEEARQRPAGGRPAPQSPGSGRDRGKERDEACVRDQIPAGVDPLVVGASRAEPGFVRKARFCRHVAHGRSLEAERTFASLYCRRFPEGCDMAQTKLAGTWTYEDSSRFPDDGRRYEIIEGELYEMPSPTERPCGDDHAISSRCLCPSSSDLRGRLFTAPLDVFFPGSRSGSTRYPRHASWQ